MNRDAWLTERRTGLGGSDVGAVLGLSPYRTPVQVWMEKTGRAPLEDLAATRRDVRFGTFGEAFVASEYERETGQRVQRFTSMLRRPDSPLLGNVDRLVIPAGQKVAAHRGQIRTGLGLECKTANAFAAGDDSQWGPSGSDEVPPAYLVQVATYMALTGCDRWHLAVLFGNGARPDDFRIFELRRDRELEREIVARAAAWWQRHVVGDVAPEPSTDADVRLLFPRSAPRTVQATEPVRLVLDTLRELRADRAALEPEIERAEVAIKALIGDAEALVNGDQILATWKSARDSRVTDWERVARELAEQAGGPALLDMLIALHTTTRAGSRRFLLKETPQ